MPRETFRDVHVDRPLTNMSLHYIQNTADFIAHRFFPTVPVNNASDLFDYYPSGYFDRIHESRRAEEGIANTIGYKVSQKSYSVEEDALRTFISDKKRANCDSSRRLDAEATALVTRALLLAKEKRFVETFMTTGLWTTNMAGVASSPSTNQFIKWSDSSSDPIGDIAKVRMEMLKAGKHLPNKAIMTYDVYEAIRSHPDFMDRIKYTGTSDRPAMTHLKSMAALFELDEILLMKTLINIAPESVEDSNGNPATNYQFMASKTILLGYVEPSVGLMSPVAGVNFAWNRYIGMGIQNGPVVRRYRENPAKKGEYIEAEMAQQFQLVAPDLGALMTDVI